LSRGDMVMVEGEEKKGRPKPGLDRWVTQSYIEGFITAAIDILIIGGIFFVLIGTGRNDSTCAMYGFLIMFIFVYTFLVPIAVIRSARRGFIRGRWEVKEDEDISDAGPLKDPWLRVGPGALVLGVAMTLIVCIILWASGVESLSPVVTCLIAFGAVIITSSVLIRLRLREDLVSFMTALSEPQPAEPLPFRPYFLREYIIPWVVAIAAINVAIGIKVFSEEALKAGGGVPLEALLEDIVIVFFAIVTWMLFECGFQIRSDIHLGLVTAIDEKPLAIPLLMLIVLAMTVVVGVLAGVPLIIAGIEDITVSQGALAHVLTAVAAGAVGMIMGVQWGRIREYRLLQRDTGA
jgi:hypothetical protein